jgi:hypothetical protein
MKYLLIACLAGLFANAARAAERDETKASQYLYCSSMSAFFITLASKHGDAETANAARQLQTHFLIAATMISDGDYVKEHQEESLKRVIAQADRERAGEDGLMMNEFKGCVVTWSKEVKPLIGWKN